MIASILDQPADTARDAGATTPAQSPHSTTTKPAGITGKTWNSLRTKQKRFVAFYAENPNAVSAYVAAGYDTTRDGRKQPAIARNAYNVRRGLKITQALAEQKQHVEQRAQDRKDRNLDWVVAELDRLKGKAEAEADAAHLAVAVRCVQLIGMTRGLFVETAVVDVVARREYSETERIQGARITRILMEEDAKQLAEDQAPREGDHRGAIVSNSAQDQAGSQGGETPSADTGSKAPSGKVDTRADRTGESEEE